jgi:adenine C2-methylase RlmN of 23S rRNA A2503 and tRNA A37
MSNLCEFIKQSKKLGHDSAVVPMSTLELVADLIDIAERVVGCESTLSLYQRMEEQRKVLAKLKGD